MSDNRREFLRKSALLGLAGVAGTLVGKEKLDLIEDLANKTADGGKYTLPALPYAFNALEPFIDAQTMELHHDKHHQAYVDKLNKAMEGNTWSGSIEELCTHITTLDPDGKKGIRNNGGGHYNHSLFWQLMKANPDAKANPASGKLSEMITADFKSFDDFKKDFSEKALKIFGSGWCWLIEQNGKLKIVTTPNQDNPLMDIAGNERGKPLLALDVWEHAYYLKYQNKRA
ncbi:MAG: superoxide dismutase, partial [Bacteroidia bacterium]